MKKHKFRYTIEWVYKMNTFYLKHKMYKCHTTIYDRDIIMVNPGCIRPLSILTGDSTT